jgi:hypothetical protein
VWVGGVGGVCWVGRVWVRGVGVFVCGGDGVGRDECNGQVQSLISLYCASVTLAHLGWTQCCVWHSTEY